MAMAIPLALPAIKGIGAALLGLTVAAGAAAVVPSIVEGGAAAVSSIVEASRRPRICYSPPPSRRPPPSQPPDIDLIKKLGILAAMMQNEKVLKEIKKMMDKKLKEKDNTDSVVNTSGCLWNKTQMDMKLKDQHQWCGHFQSGPPPTNSKNEKPTQKMNKSPPEVIWHNGVPPSGSKAAVAYTAHSRQWILAWHVPLPSSSSSSSSNKIYVESGPERKIDWNVIEKKLDAATNISQCDDAVAEITSGPVASISAIFVDPDDF